MAWYRKAADQGLAKAQAEMGLLTKDKTQSKAWYHKAAMQGYDFQASKLGVVRQVQGVLMRSIYPSDTLLLEEAYFWFCIAIAQGDEDSVLDLEKAAKELTAEKIAKAKKECNAWKVPPVKESLQ